MLTATNKQLTNKLGTQWNALKAGGAVVQGEDWAHRAMMPTTSLLKPLQHG